MEGYVKLYRKILDSEIMKGSPATLQAFIVCLCLAHWKDNGTDQIGSFKTSLNHFSRVSHLTIQQTRTAWINMEKLGIIALTRTTQWTKIIVLKYSEYQFVGYDSSTHESTSVLTHENNEPTQGMLLENARARDVKDVTTLESLRRNTSEAGMTNHARSERGTLDATPAQTLEKRGNDLHPSVVKAKEVFGRKVPYSGPPRKWDDIPDDDIPSAEEVRLHSASEKFIKEHEKRTGRKFLEPFDRTELERQKQIEAQTVKPFQRPVNESLLREKLKQRFEEEKKSGIVWKPKDQSLSDPDGILEDLPRVDDGTDMPSSRPSP